MPAAELRGASGCRLGAEPTRSRIATSPMATWGRNNGFSPSNLSRQTLDCRVKSSFKVNPTPYHLGYSETEDTQ